MEEEFSFRKPQNRILVASEREAHDIAFIAKKYKIEAVYFYDERNESIRRQECDFHKDKHQIHLWMQGVPFEITFWMRTLGEQKESKLERSSQGFPYKDLLEKYTKPRILECGSGPIAYGAKNQEEATLVSCDPLANLYAYVLQELAISPENPTMFSYVERLSDKFAPASFEIILMENALDHSFAPVIGILEMIKCLQVGGTIRLVHAENEAEDANYTGFHQWNIAESEGVLWIWNEGNAINVNALLQGCAEVKVQRSEYCNARDCIIADIVKKKDVENTQYAHKMILAELDEALLNFFLTTTMQNIRIKKEKTAEQLLHFCNLKPGIVIFGAGQYGKSIARFLLSKNIKIEAFVVSDGQVKENAVLGIPVLYFSQIRSKNHGIVVAVAERYQKQIRKILEKPAQVFFVPGAYDLPYLLERDI